MNTYEFMKQCIHIDNIRYLNGRPNISRNCIKHLLQISSSNDVIINIADKNLGLCINDVSWYSMPMNIQDTYQLLILIKSFHMMIYIAC